jgi:hypothetical protein
MAMKLHLHILQTQQQGGESGESISAGAETNYTFDSHP